MSKRNHKGKGKNSSVTSSYPRNYRFLNPYNFVRYLPPYQTPNTTDKVQASDLLGRETPPPHDRWVGISGKIRCKATAVTPIFVSSSENVEQDKHKHRSYEFFRINGTKAIPASSLRGMIRSVYEAVTNSCFSNLDGRKLSHRQEVSDGPKLVPARVRYIKKSKTWKLTLLTGTESLRIEDNPPRQYAAWIQRYGPLQPSKTLSQNTKLSRRVYDNNGEPNKVSIGKLKHGSKCYAIIEEFQHPIPKVKFWDVVKISKHRQNLEAYKRRNQQIVQGWLCITNQNTERKHSERLFFTTQNRLPEPELTDKVRQDYEALIRDYQHIHRDDVKKREKPWLTKKLKEKDEHGENRRELAFSRYTYAPGETKLKHGDLVYACLTGSYKAPIVQYIVPTSISRMAHEQSIGDLLRIHAPHLQRCPTYDELCPACRLFGWVHGQEEGAYRGRVRFTNALCKKPGEELSPKSLRLKILSSPKPTTTRFYLADKDGQPFAPDDTKTGYTEHNRLRGRKFYRHYLPRSLKDITLTEAQQNQDKNWDQNRTIRDAEGKGAEFTFDILFENLTEIELGALLWSLTLGGKGYHKVGYGKPLGLGSVEIEIDDKDSSLYDWISRYQSLDNAATWEKLLSANKQAEIIAHFQEEMGKVYTNVDVEGHSEWQKVFERLPNIQDILALTNKEPSPLPVHYPLSPDSNSKGQFEWFVGNNKLNGPPLGLTTEDEGLPLITKDGKVW